MRLIDADALLDQYNLKDATKYGNKDADQQAHSYGTLMMYEIADLIEDAPTVYDVDKVVDQLEEIRVKKTCNKEKCDEKELCRICVVDDASEIVKGGGVNE